jgi:hypothetical protein
MVVTSHASVVPWASGLPIPRHGFPCARRGDRLRYECGYRRGTLSRATITGTVPRKVGAAVKEWCLQGGRFASGSICCYPIMNFLRTERQFLTLCTAKM